MPSPFTIAVLLTFLTMALGMVFTEESSGTSKITTVLSYWESGIWNNGLLVFAYQMMLILVLGHVLVLSKPMEQLMLGITKGVKNTSTAEAERIFLISCQLFCRCGRRVWNS